jgi:hypothetical protein
MARAGQLDTHLSILCAAGVRSACQNLIPSPMTRACFPRVQTCHSNLP